MLTAVAPRHIVERRVAGGVHLLLDEAGLVPPELLALIPRDLEVPHRHETAVLVAGHHGDLQEDDLAAVGHELRLLLRGEVADGTENLDRVAHVRVLDRLAHVHLGLLTGGRRSRVVGLLGGVVDCGLVLRRLLGSRVLFSRVLGRGLVCGVRSAAGTQCECEAGGECSRGGGPACGRASDVHVSSWQSRQVRTRRRLSVRDSA